MISLDIFEDRFLGHDYKVMKYTNWASRWYHLISLKTVFSSWLQSYEIYKPSESVISSSLTTPISSLYPVTCHLSIAIVMSMEYWSGQLRWLIIVYNSQNCVRDNLEQNLDVRNQKWRIKTRRNTFWSINNVAVVAYCLYQLKWCPGPFGKGHNLEVRGQK